MSKSAQKFRENNNLKSYETIRNWKNVKIEKKQKAQLLDNPEKSNAWDSVIELLNSYKWNASYESG